MQTRTKKIIFLAFLIILYIAPIRSSGYDDTSTIELADTVELTTGTLITGNLAATHAVDGSNYQIEELIGASSFNFAFNFTTSGDYVSSLSLYGYYDGNPAHVVEGQLYDWVIETWDVIDVYPDAGSDAWYNVSVNSVDYANGELILLRIIHTSTGSAGHDFYLDYVEIVTVSLSSETNIFEELFLSLELWGYFGPLGLVIIGYLLTKKDKALGIFMIIVDSLVISHYLALVDATPNYWWNIFILLLGVIQCTFQLMDR